MPRRRYADLRERVCVAEPIKPDGRARYSGNERQRKLQAGWNRGINHYPAPDSHQGRVFYLPRIRKGGNLMSEENLYTFENEAYRKTYWHTCSHVMA